MDNDVINESPEQTTLQAELIKRVKQNRKDLDAVLQEVKLTQDCIARGAGGRECSLAVTNLQQSIMWLGMVLKEMNTPNPYPNSYNPTNAIVEPTADGLKL